MLTKRLILLAILLFPILTLAFWLYKGVKDRPPTTAAMGQGSNAPMVQTNQPAK